MFLKRTPLLLALAASLIFASVASAASTRDHASLLIRHQTHGCHSWSVDGGAFKVTQSISLKRGGWLAVRNDDVMPHRLVLTSGPALRIAHAELGHPGAVLRVKLTRPGVYHFTTKPGDDYMAGMKTIGEDNVLRLTVHVS